MTHQSRILIVDDAPENIRVLMAALKDEYQVLAATSGEKALAVAAKEPHPDLVLLDVMMPGMDGYEVCERLAQDPVTAKIPVIFVTALSEAGDEARGLELGAVDYITKPFNITLVKARVHNQLELKRYRDNLEEAVEARTRELLVTTAQKEKLEGELRVARSLQMAMIPAGSSRGAGGEYEIAAALEPAKAVGGDLFDYVVRDDGRLCFFVGDVSDKGVPAALFMVKAITLMRTEAVRQGSPADILQNVNAQLSRDNDECMFVTLLIGILDLATGALCLASAGHEPPLLFTSGGVEYLRVAGGPAMGFGGSAGFEAHEIPMQPGDGIMLYTDGITEALDVADNQFGEARLLDVANKSRERPAAELTADVLADVAGFVGSADQSDDMTLFTLRYHGPGGSTC